MLGQLIGGFVVLLIGTTLVPTIADLVSDAQCLGNQVNATLGQTCNVTGTASVVVGLVTLFYVLAIMATALGIAVSGLKSSGVM